MAVERWWHKARTILRKVERLEWVTTPLIGIMVFGSDFGSNFMINIGTTEVFSLFEMGIWGIFEMED